MAQMVARYNGVVEVASSNLVTQTIKRPSIFADGLLLFPYVGSDQYKRETCLVKIINILACVFVIDHL